MKNSILNLAIFTIALSPCGVVGQSDNQDEASKSETQGVTVNTSACVFESPDIIKVVVNILEYVHTDPLNQETTSIDLEVIEKKFYDKLKDFDISKDDVEFVSIMEANNNQGYNAYGNQYNTTKKKALCATYSFTWNKDKEELPAIFEALRFNGISFIGLNGEYSEELLQSIRTELIEKCILKGKLELNLISDKSNLNTGDIISFEETPDYGYNQVYNNYNVYNHNYNQQGIIKTKHSLNTKITFEILD
jgi:hypothetical protein